MPPSRRPPRATSPSNATRIWPPTASPWSSTTTTSKRLTGRKGKVRDLTSHELGALTVGGTSDHVPSLKETLALVAGRVPIIIELKGAEDSDEGLVTAVADELAGYAGHAAIMSFDHHLVRRFAE